VEHLTSAGALPALERTLRESGGKVTSMQSGQENSALILPLHSIVAAAQHDTCIEVHSPPEADQASDVAFVSASAPATADFLHHLTQDPASPQSSPLLAASTLPALIGISLEPTGGTIVIKAGDEKSEFVLYRVSQKAQEKAVTFEPVKQPIGEGSGNLRHRADWFRSRTGQ
jgi:hypothetical protein